MKNNKNIALILIFLIATGVLATGGAYYFFYQKTQKQVACTMEAKICPDGSAVGRIGPNCEFAACPDLKNGLLKGKLTIGPLCPVEPCQATALNPYTSRKIILQNQTGEFFKLITLKEDGSFETEIGAGIYVLSLSDCSFLGCNRSLPKTVIIESGKTTEIEIGIDTGIR